MMKGLGLNALSIYVIWNFHELSKGNFDFSTANKNLPLFLELA
jgi:beta-galactosidase